MALRLMVVGNLDGRLAAAAAAAMDRGAPVRHADGVDTALALLCAGHGADLLMVDAAADIRGLAAQLEAARLAVPIVACGAVSDAGTAVNAVNNGAREYIPLPADPDVIGAILVAVADDGREPAVPRAGQGHREGMVARLRCKEPALAQTATRSLFGRTVADVERDLILETLERCLGNRTHAASLLGISIRTLRNKLTVYATEGIDVPPPNSGDIRGAA